MVLIGTCFILKYGSILDFIRVPLTKLTFFKKLFSCALCLGFWIGLLWGSVSTGSLYYVLQLALFSSGVCWLADHAVMVAQKYLYGDKPI